MRRSFFTANNLDILHILSRIRKNNHFYPEFYLSSHEQILNEQIFAQTLGENNLQFHQNQHFYLLDLATRSSSSFFLIQKLLLLPLAAFMSSSAKHSATVLMFLKAAFLAPDVISQIAWLTLRIGETSQACRHAQKISKKLKIEKNSQISGLKPDKEVSLAQLSHKASVFL